MNFESHHDKRLWALGGEEILEALIPVIFVGEGLLAQCVGQGQKLVTVGGCKVYVVLCVDKNFPAEFNQLLTGDGCGVGSGAVVKEADGPVIQALVFSMSGQMIHWLT